MLNFIKLSTLLICLSSALAKTVEPPIIIAIRNSDIASVQTLLDSGADVNAPYNKTNPLFEAIKLNLVSIVELLLDRGATSNIMNIQRQTPLIAAIATEGIKLEIITLLLKHGAGIDVATKDNVTPLMTAVLRGRLDIIIELLGWGEKHPESFLHLKTQVNFPIDLNSPTYFKKLPADIILMINRYNILPNWCAFLNARTSTGSKETALDLATLKLMESIQRHENPAEIDKRKRIVDIITYYIEKYCPAAPSQATTSGAAVNPHWQRTWADYFKSWWHLLHQ